MRAYSVNEDFLKKLKGISCMDYQRTDRFRPTCTCRKTQPQVAPPSVAPLSPTQPTSDKRGVNIIENETTIAMVFSPKQLWQNLYDPMKALSRGTLFADLDKPFQPNLC